MEQAAASSAGSSRGGFSHGGFARGDKVHRPGEPGRIGIIEEDPREIGGVEQCLVAWLDGSGSGWVDASSLAALRPGGPRFAPAADFMADLALLKYRHEFADVIFSIGASRTEFLPYQFRPVLQFIQHRAQGLLIADEVGLGKTIEAALIIRELAARGALHRLLVICPAGLRAKWKQELHHRFGIALQDLSGRDFDQLSEQLRRNRAPRFYGIASLEGLRRIEFERDIVESGANFDLVVIDEAHHLRNRSTSSHRLGMALSQQADHVLLLSATPLQTGQDDLLNLLTLVAPAEFDGVDRKELETRLEPNRHLNKALRALAEPEAEPKGIAFHMRAALATRHGRSFRSDELFMAWFERLLSAAPLSREETVRLRRDLQSRHTLAPYYTRTRKRDVQNAAEREAKVIKVPLGPEERRFYDAWVEFLAARSRTLAPNVPPGWAITSRERQAASSLITAAERAEELIADVEGVGANDYEGLYEDDDEIEAARASRPAAATATVDAKVVAELRAAAAALPARDAKFEHLAELLRDLLRERPSRKVLIFTFFKATFTYLLRELERAGISCEGIWGAHPAADRAARIENFKRDPDQHVLICTEVGAEGLDFQFCDAVVNYDLPWNPMRVEQRIGRIDRYGQEQPSIAVASLFVEDTIDTRILLRLYERIGIFRESIGELEPILGPVIDELKAGAFRAELSPDQQARRSEEAADRIIQARLDLEQIERAGAQLLGQDDLLNAQIDAAQSSGRYISPAEVRALLQRWLRRIDHGHGGIEPAQRARVYRIRMSQSAVSEAYRWIDGGDAPDADALAILQMIEAQDFAEVTFDQSQARGNESIPFLHAGHALVRMAATALQDETPADWKTRAGCFQLPAPLWDERARSGLALAVYRLTIRAIETRSTLVPIAVGLDPAEAREELSDALLGALPTAPEIEAPAWIDEALMQRVELAAHGAAMQRKDAAEELERRQQSANASTEAAALRRTYEYKIRQSRLRRDQVGDDRIRALHEGRARNLERELARKLEPLEHPAAPEAELELLSLAVFAPRAAAG